MADGSSSLMWLLPRIVSDTAFEQEDGVLPLPPFVEICESRNSVFVRFAFSWIKATKCFRCILSLILVPTMANMMSSTKVMNGQTLAQLSWSHSVKLVAYSTGPVKSMGKSMNHRTGHAMCTAVMKPSIIRHVKEPWSWLTIRVPVELLKTWSGS
mmetsp:Transcript_134307/g.261563  ORF Transcript_134307/g.261563 Transcript_134307/m.261563 type:complete len:155 (+) Transcript_134307:1399-1863(+)